MSSAHERLAQFLGKKMQMSHIYQPVMLQVLLTGSGRASIRTIATAVLAHDESRIDYRTEIVSRSRGDVNFACEFRFQACLAGRIRPS